MTLFAFLYVLANATLLFSVKLITKWTSIVFNKSGLKGDSSYNVF